MKEVILTDIRFGEIPPPPCEDYTTEAECIVAGCYWYDATCHSKPKSEVQWAKILIAGGIAVLGVAYVATRQKL